MHGTHLLHHCSRTQVGVTLSSDINGISSAVKSIFAEDVGRKRNCAFRNRYVLGRLNSRNFS